MTDAVLTSFDARLTEWHVAPTCATRDPVGFPAFHSLTRTQRLSLFRDAGLAAQLVPLYVHALGTAGSGDKSSYIVQRIGSPSKYGEVYVVCVHGVYLAAKVLPITSDETAAMNAKEVEVAVQASNLVESGKCANFPLVYFYAPRVQTTLRDASSQVALRGRLKQCRAELVSLLLSSDEVGSSSKKLLQRRQDAWLTLAADVDVSQPKGQWMAELGKAFNIEQLRISQRVFNDALGRALDKTPSFEATVLFSELADVDLKNVYLAQARAGLPAKLAACASAFVSLRTFQKVCVDLISAVESLQRLNVVHNDLHLANVLVFCDGPDVLALVHDFGNAKRVAGAWSPGERAHDLHTLFGAMRDALENSKLSADIRRIVDGVCDAINDYLTANRTDTVLFSQLRAVVMQSPATLADAAPVDSAALSRLRVSTLRAGYAHVYLGMHGLYQ